MTQAAPEEIWRSRLAAWRASGQSATRFAQEHGFSATSLWKWQKRLREPSTARFVQLVRRAAPPPIKGSVRSTEQTLVVEIAGARLHVTDATDEALFRRVVRALGAER